MFLVDQNVLKIIIISKSSSKGTEKVSLATIAVTTVLCSWYLNHDTIGDTLDCFLGASQKSVLVAKTRNIHISSFIGILNKIMAKIGIYPIISSTKTIWSVFLDVNISHDVLEILPSKMVILPAIEDNLNEIWYNEWSHSIGLCQTIFWFTKPDPILAAKLINMSREDLGKCIQFFTGHSWWLKHLQIAKLSISSQ